MTIVPEVETALPLLADSDAAVRRVALLRVAEYAHECPQLFVVASRDTDAGVRLEAARALEGVTDPEAMTALAALLEDEDAEVATAARASLVEINDPAAAPALLALLGQNRPGTSAALLAALRGLRHPGVLAPALAALEHDSADVRREAVGALAYLRDASALPALATRLVNDVDPIVRRAAAGALSFAEPIHNDALLPAFGHALTADTDWQVREETIATIDKLGWPSSVALLGTTLENDAAWEVRLKAARALGRLRAIEAIPALIAALSHAVANLRKEAAGALGVIAHPCAATALEETARRDTDLDVRKAASRALEALLDGA
jgi:HEAT repeat protein